MKKEYHFTFTISGTEETEEEALEDALEFFAIDPGEPDIVTLIESTKPDVREPA